MQIVPIKDLKNTTAISERCHNAAEPIFVTKNGYGDMVIMSIDTYEERMGFIDMLQKLKLSEIQFSEGKTKDAREALSELRAEYGI